MAYDPISGKLGAMSSGGSAQQLKQWILEETADEHDTSAFGATADGDGNVARTFKIGLVSGQIRASGRYDNGNSPLATTAFRKGKSYAIILTITTGISVSATALVTQATVTNNVEGMVDFEVVLRVTGDVSYDLTP